MTNLALRMASRINAVSSLHAQKAKDLWPDHPMFPITNGIHIRTWDKIGKSEIRDPKSEINPNDKNLKEQNVLNLESSNLEIVSNFDIHISDFWLRHQENKKELLQVIEKKTGQQWSENDLLIGWARRIVGYKRPLALFQEKERLTKLLKNEKQPLRVVLAGSAHESDTEGATMLEDLQKMIVEEFDGYVVYLPNYNVKVGKMMTAGCDIWLNTPVVGFEACGTSGMKACLNGVLPCTTKDGWVDEIDLYGIGWTLDNASITDSLLSTLENYILPMYYLKDEKAMPTAWVENMKHSREMILSNYSASRMLKQYIELMYLQSLASLKFQ
jgi:starch phosphorylase